MAAVFKQVAASPSMLSNLVQINNYEFIGASQVFRKNQSSTAGLYKYNTISNEWKLLFKYPPEFMPVRHQICYHKSHDTIYMLWGQEQKMIIFDLNNLRMEITVLQATDIGIYPILLMINEQCHIILGSQSKYHYKWYPESKQLDQVFRFSHLGPEELESGLYQHGIVHIQSQNRFDDELA